MVECECSEEYGPCEAHGVVLVQREGAAVRTADELLAVFLHDALDLQPDVLSPYGTDVLARADAALDANRQHGVAWLPEDADTLRDELVSVSDQVESALDASVFWEDGYVIVRPTDDCPLLYQD